MALGIAVVVLLRHGGWFFLKPEQVGAGVHHPRHLELFGAGVPRLNRAVLAGVDRVQATAPDGGGYFIGVHAVPAESPVGYGLSLLGKPMLDPPRTTSYCSGSSYAAFIEALNSALGFSAERLSDDRSEAFRMQEPDGGRREDFVKMWGLWNADGPGTLYAMVEYTHIGTRIRPEDARPGDFFNISWKSGLGHSVVFLGWVKDAAGKVSVRYWSSQKGTNGYGDQTSPVAAIKDVVAVRLTHPEAIYRFNVAEPIEKKVTGDVLQIEKASSVEHP